MLVAYADDFVILRKQAYTRTQLDWMTKKLAREDLSLHPEKTHCVDMGQTGQAFDFLGFQFERVLETV